MKPKAISVVIPSWRGEKILPSTLEALAGSKDVSFEVVVVDHGRSGLASQALVDRYSFVYVGRDEQLGFTGAVSLGVELSKYDLVLVLCNDVRVRSDTLAKLLEEFEQECDRGANPVIFPKVEGKGEVPLVPNLWMRYVERIGSVPFAFPDGSAFLFSKSKWGQPFPRDYFLYQEDVAFGWRVLRYGGIVLEAKDAYVFNFDGGTTKRTPAMVTYYSERNRWRNYLVYFSFSTLWKLAPLLFLDGLAKLILARNFSARFRAAFWVLGFSWWKERRVIQSLAKESDRVILRSLSFRFGGGRIVDKVVNPLLRVYLRVVGLELAP